MKRFSITFSERFNETHHSERLFEIQEQKKNEHSSDGIIVLLNMFWYRLENKCCVRFFNFKIELAIQLVLMHEGNPLPYGLWILQTCRSKL